LFVRGLAACCELAVQPRKWPQGCLMRPTGSRRAEYNEVLTACDALMEQYPKKSPAARALPGVRLGSFSLLIDGRLRYFRQGLVCGLFLIQRFLQQVHGVIETEFLGPGLQRTVA